MPSPRRLLITISLFSVLFLTAALTAGAFLMRTDFGRTALTSMIETAISASGQQVKITKLEGLLPSEIRVDKISISDRDGIWLDAENVVLQWRPLELWQRRLHIDRLYAAVISVKRPPIPDTDSSTGIARPVLLPVVDKAVFDRIVVEIPGEGQSSAFSLHGSLASPGAHSIDTELHLQTLDGPASRLDVSATIKLSESTLALQLEAFEPEHGIISRLLGRTDTPAMSLIVKGDGPLAEWPASYKFTSGSTIIVSGDLSAHLGENPRVNLAGEAYISTDSPFLSAIASEPLKFGFDSQLDAEQWAITLESLFLTGPAWRVTGESRIALESLSLDGRIAINVDNSEIFSKWGHFRKADTTLKLSGSMTAPTVAMTGSIHQPGSAGLSAHSIDITGNVALASSGDLADLSISVGIDQPKSGNRIIDDALGQRIDIGMTGQALQGFEYVIIEEFHFVGAALSVDADGWLDNETIDVSWNFHMKEPETGISDIDSWLGNDLTAAGQMMGSSEQWWLKSLHVSSGGLTLNGNMVLAGTPLSIEGDYDLTFDSLKPLGELVGTPISGRMSTHLGISGAAVDPDISAEFNVEKPVINTFPVESLKGHIQLERIISAPSGPIALHVGMGQEVIDISTTFVGNKPDPEFRNIRLSGPSSSGGGDISVSVSEGIATGQFRLNIADMGPLVRLAGEEAQGRLIATFDMGAQEGTQQVAVHFDGQEIVLPKISVALSGLTGRVTARTGSEEILIDGEIRGKDLATNYAKIDDMRIAFSGSPRMMSTHVSATGRKGELETLSLEAVVEERNTSVIATISKLSAHIFEIPVELNTQAIIELSPKQVNVPCFDASVSSGHTRICFNTQGGQIDATTTLTALPVALLGDVLAAVDNAPEEWPRHGLINAKITATGKLDQPNVKAALHVEQLKLQENSSPEDMIDADAMGTYFNGIWQAEASINGPKGTNGHVTAAIPGLLSLYPWVMDIDNQEPFQAALSLQGELSAVQRFIPLNSHRISGTVDGQLKASGTISRPVLQGAVNFSKGQYENLKVGTILADIELNAEGNGAGLVLHSLRASDKMGGILQGRGEVSGLMDGHEIQMSLNLEMDKMHLVRRDDLSMAVTGEVEIKGPLSSPHLQGVLSLAPIEIKVPDSLPAEIVDLPVTETIGGPASINRDKSSQELLADNMASTFTMNLKIDIPNRMYLRGRGLTSEWAGNFEVNHSTGPIRINGILRPVRGEYIFAGKVFRLKEGTIAFSGEDQAIPILNLVAEYKRSDFTAFFHLSGKADALNISLSAIPEMPQDEILSRVLFGHGTGQLTLIEAAQLADAIAQLSGKKSIGGGGLESIRQAIGVDVLRFEGSEEGAGTSATVGKYLSEGVYVGVKQGASPKNSGATVEVELTPHVTLESEVRQDSTTRLGVKWEWDY